MVFTFLFLITPNFNLTTGNNIKSPEYREKTNLDGENLKISKVSGPIYIDDNDQSANWSVAAFS